MLDTFEEKDILKEIGYLKKRIAEIESRGRMNILGELTSNSYASPENKERIFRPLLTVSLITAALMTIYESFKQYLFPDLTLWQSHSVTILFASIIAPLGAYFAFKKINEMRHKALIEIAERKKAEEELIKSREELEQHVLLRTEQLSMLNEDLKKENRMRRDAEESLRKYTEELLINRDLLQHKAEELAIVNEQLQEGEKELTELNKSKDKFFSILAHDLRSPFTSLLGLTEFLENEFSTLDEEEIKKIVMNISVSSGKVYKLLENLLQWSRVQTGKIEFSPEIFEVNPLIDDVIGLCKINSARKNIQINNLLQSPVWVNADRHMIETVFRNIISNAVKFTNQEGTVNILARINEPGIVWFTVSDNGIGMSRERISTLFSIDTNKSYAGTDNEKGTGLGLVICHEFIKMHKSKIWAESLPGEGSSFHFTLQTASNKQD